MSDPNIVTSSLSKRIPLDDSSISIEIYKLEGEPAWQLEVVDENGTSVVWDDTFSSDQDALDIALETIKNEGHSIFKEGNVIQFPR